MPRRTKGKGDTGDKNKGKGDTGDKNKGKSPKKPNPKVKTPKKPSASEKDTAKNIRKRRIAELKARFEEEMELEHESIDGEDAEELEDGDEEEAGVDEIAGGEGPAVVENESLQAGRIVNVEFPTPKYQM